MRTSAKFPAPGDFAKIQESLEIRFLGESWHFRYIGPIENIGKILLKTRNTKISWKMVHKGGGCRRHPPPLCGGHRPPPFSRTLSEFREFEFLFSIVISQCFAFRLTCRDCSSSSACRTLTGDFWISLNFCKVQRRPDL